MFNLINGSNHAWPTRKPWLNQAYNASEVGDFNQIYQKTLVKPGLRTRLLRWKISTRPTTKAG